MDPESLTTSCQELHKDFSLPNSSWKKELMDLYEKFMEQTKSGTWKRLPLYIRNYSRRPETEPSSRYRTRFFNKNLDEGTGLEYVMFLNLGDKRVVGLFQMGPYLEGPPGFTHGGCIATIIDEVSWTCADHAVGNALTANLNIEYRNPVPLGSVVVVESHVDRIEGRKLFVSCWVRSTDGAILFAEATGIFIKRNEARL